MIGEFLTISDTYYKLLKQYNYLFINNDKLKYYNNVFDTVYVIGHETKHNSNYWRSSKYYMYRRCSCDEYFNNVKIYKKENNFPNAFYNYIKISFYPHQIYSFNKRFKLLDTNKSEFILDTCFTFLTHGEFNQKRSECLEKE